MKGLLTLMAVSAALTLSENDPLKSEQEAIGDIEDTLEYLHANEEDGDGPRAKLQNLAILRAQVVRYAAYLLPSLTPADVQFLLKEATE